jgi:hypothetical protein
MLARLDSHAFDSDAASSNPGNAIYMARKWCLSSFQMRVARWSGDVTPEG